MLDITLDGARVAVEYLKRVFASPGGIFFSAALSGMVGIVLVLAFFSLLFASSSLPVLLPFILAFNAASSGFYLVDKGGRNFPHLRVSLIVLGCLLAAAGCLSISVLLPWEPMMDGIRSLISGLSALAFSFFGAWIGSRNKSTDRNLQST